MKWIPQDIDMYLQAKEYVDTAVLPLLPVSFDADIKHTASMTEFITLLSIQMERQFKGRLLLLPGFSYLKSMEVDKLVENLKVWETEILQKGFKYVFYATSDPQWKTHEKNLNGSLIWIPSLPLENLDEQYKKSILEDQVKQLLNVFIQKWRESD